MRLDIAQVTHVGDRAVNEDACACVQGPAGWLFALADGLGGHGRGDEAAQLVVQQVQRQFAQMPEGMQPAALLAQLFEDAQRALLALQEAEGCPGAMKTTLNLVLVSGMVATFAHIGDSRSYIFRKRRQLQRTKDHSVPQLRVAVGEITEDEIRGHPHRNQLLRVMGIEWGPQSYEIGQPVPLQKGDALLLCSDGFWELIDEKQMMKALRCKRQAAKWLAAMDRRVAKAGRKKNKDNSTAVAVLVKK